MSFKLIKTRQGRVIRASSEAFGVVDGVAGAWSNPKYIENKPLDYTPGTRKYYTSTTKLIRRSCDNYRNELEGCS